MSELRILKEHRPKAVLLPLYWEPQGLLPWAKAGNDADLCWLVGAEPVGNWPVVILRTQSRTHERFDMSAVRFLARVAKGSVTFDLLPEHFPGTNGVAFMPSHSMEKLR